MGQGATLAKITSRRSESWLCRWALPHGATIVTFAVVYDAAHDYYFVVVNKITERRETPLILEPFIGDGVTHAHEAGHCRRIAGAPRISQRRGGSRSQKWCPAKMTARCFIFLPYSAAAEAVAEQERVFAIRPYPEPRVGRGGWKRVSTQLTFPEREKGSSLLLP